jgi:hypothetical protein
MVQMRRRFCVIAAPIASFSTEKASETPNSKGTKTGNQSDGHDQVRVRHLQELQAAQAKSSRQGETQRSLRHPDAHLTSDQDPRKGTE